MNQQPQIHWNVTGPMFQTLHLMFGAQYNELALAVDLVAERIRALGFPAPGTYKQFSALSAIKEERRAEGTGHDHQARRGTEPSPARRARSSRSPRA